MSKRSAVVVDPGGTDEMINPLATGTNHNLRTVDHRVHGELRPDYDLVQSVCSVVISAPHTDIWRNTEIFADESLPTNWTKYFGERTGDAVQATTDIYSYLGGSERASADEQSVAADYQRIKEWESQNRIDPVEGV